jgi:hypothetical protein
MVRCGSPALDGSDSGSSAGDGVSYVARHAVSDATFVKERRLALGCMLDMLLLTLLDLIDALPQR